MLLLRLLFKASPVLYIECESLIFVNATAISPSNDFLVYENNYYRNKIIIILASRRRAKTASLCSRPPLPLFAQHFYAGDV